MSALLNIYSNHSIHLDLEDCKEDTKKTVC